jgi:hypothetical protein
MKKTILLILVVIFIAIQFFRIDTTNPKSDPHKDFFTVSNPPEDIKTIFKNSCYDCHSDQTEYPWYSHIAPVSWLLKSHIDEGRENLNFSEWGDYSTDEQNEILEICQEKIKAEEMPLSAYTMMHSNAKLDEKKKTLLFDWFKKQIQKNDE